MSLDFGSELLLKSKMDRQKMIVNNEKIKNRVSLLLKEESKIKKKIMETRTRAL